MQFKSSSKDQVNGLNHSGLLIPQQVPESVVGKLCQVIEMLGLKDTQEKATKDTIKNIIYDVFGHDGSCLYIETDLYTVIESVIWQERNYSNKNGLLVGSGDYRLEKTITEQPLTAE